MHHVVRRPVLARHGRYHVGGITAPGAVRLPRARASIAVPGALWRVALGLLRRPLLALTLAIAAILLFSAASEAVAAQRLEAQVAQAQQANASLQVQLTQIAAATHARTTPAALTAAAERLGWTFPIPTPAP
jgi:hypothetical protein